MQKQPEKNGREKNKEEKKESPKMYVMYCK
jgi:hypothetical protein